MGRRVGPYRPRADNLFQVFPSEIHFDEEPEAGVDQLLKLCPRAAISTIPADDRHVNAARRKLSRVFKNGIPIEAIAYSSCSENAYRSLDADALSVRDQVVHNTELLTQFRLNCVPKPKNTD